MREKIRENRTLAWIVLAVVVLLSISLSGGTALRKSRAEVMDVFHYGVNNDSLCIYNDLQARVECAFNLASTAGRYETIAQDAIASAEEAAQELSAVGRDDVGALYSKNTALTRAVETLYTELENAPLSDSDATFALAQYKEFSSRGLTITRDGYNARAEEFNRTLSAFPANLVATLSGVRELALFR